MVFVVLGAVAIAMAVAGFILIGHPTGFDERIVGMMLIGLSVVALVPLTWPVLFQREGRGTAVDLGIRRLRAEARSGVVAATVLATVVTIGAVTTIYIVTAVDNVNASTESFVAPAQLEFAPDFDDPDENQAAADALQVRLDAAPPVRLHATDGVAASLTGSTVLVESADALEQLIGRSLTDPESDLLSSGGTLVTKTDAEATIQFYLYDGSLITVESAPFRDIDPSFRNVHGFMLAEVAKSLGMDIVATTYVFTQVSDALVADRVSIARDIDVDPRQLRVYWAPDTMLLPMASVIGAIVVSLLAALTLFAYGTGVTRRMRPHLAALRSLGLPKSWLGVMLGTQFLGIIAVALLAGLTGGVVGALAMLVNTGFGASIAPPWLFFSALLVLLVVSALLAALIGRRRLSTAERLERFADGVES